MCVVKTVRAPRLVERLLEARPLPVDPGARGLDRRQRRVALVHVHDARLDPQLAQRRGAADAEDRVLREPRVGVAVVQARGDPAAHAVVLGQLGVEQEQRDAPDVDPPDLRDDVGVADRDVSFSGSRSSPRVTSAAGVRSGSVGIQYSCCQPVASMRWRK